VLYTATPDDVLLPAWQAANADEKVFTSLANALLQAKTTDDKVAAGLEWVPRLGEQIVLRKYCAVLVDAENIHVVAQRTRNCLRNNVASRPTVAKAGDWICSLWVSDICWALAIDQTAHIVCRLVLH
jgi:hypothetical protein